MRHPQLFVSPFVKLFVTTSTRIPQSHRHLQLAFFCLLPGIRSTTVKRPKRCPVKSMSRDISDLLYVDADAVIVVIFMLHTAIKASVVISQQSTLERVGDELAHVSVVVYVEVIFP